MPCKLLLDQIGPFTGNYGGDGITKIDDLGPNLISLARPISMILIGSNP